MGIGCAILFIVIYLVWRKILEKEIGVLCHVSSLPSKYGVGDFGKEAYKFVDFLAKNGVKIWQILPLNQTGETNCPYYSDCSFSYDEMFFDVDDLVKRKLIKKDDASKLANFQKDDKVDYSLVKKEKKTIFEKAYQNASKEILQDLDKYLSENQDVFGYAVYRSMLEKNNIFDWRLLEKDLLDCETKKYVQFEKDNKQLILKYGFYQYILDMQWKALKKYANDQGVMILGDLPIYPNVMSYDVYMNKSAYQLDKKFNMLCTGGVPKSSPDEIEQNWGSCVYDWKYLEKTNYEYLIKKIKMLLEKFDVLRLDHFYGYVEHYEYSTKNSAENKWVRASGMDFFSKLGKHVDMNKVVVENLGFIKEECDKVMKNLNLTGMCLLQDVLACDRYLPKKVEQNNIFYLGTHDSNTFIGFYDSLDETKKEKFCKLLEIEKGDSKNVLISALKQVYKSPAKYVIFQVQDLLLQGSFSRMNIPGIAFGQWEYKMPKNYSCQVAKTLKEIRE